MSETETKLRKESALALGRRLISEMTRQTEEMARRLSLLESDCLTELSPDDITALEGTIENFQDELLNLRSEIMVLRDIDLMELEKAKWPPSVIPPPDGRVMHQALNFKLSSAAGWGVSSRLSGWLISEYRAGRISSCVLDVCAPGNSGLCIVPNKERGEISVYLRGNPHENLLRTLCGHVVDYLGDLALSCQYQRISEPPDSPGHPVVYSIELWKRTSD
jgi:hypothetical protein